MQYIDLHTHTRASDGSDSPSELVIKAAKLGLCAIAITDHDTLLGLEEGTKQGEISNIEVIRGCELSVQSDGGEIHLLGLWVAQECQELEHGLNLLRKYRAERNKIIVNRLKDMGTDVCYEELLAVAGGDAIGRPHIAALLKNKGYVSSINEAFVRYLGSRGKAYEPKKMFTVEEAMHLLHSAKASICLAHPGLIRCSDAWLDQYLAHLKKLGLSAIEVYHSSHDRKTERLCLRLAQKYGLDISGGSDYHGLSKPDIHLGCGKGNLRINSNILSKLKQSRINKNLPL